MPETLLELNQHDHDSILMDIRNNFFRSVPFSQYLNQNAEFIRQNLNPVLEITLYHSLNIEMPVRRSYQANFLKYIINLFEGTGIEIEEKVYLDYLQLLNSSCESKNFVHFFINNNIVSIKQKSSLISDGTTGLALWQACIVQEKYINKNYDKFRDKNILELGSGLGFAGISTILNCYPRLYCFSDNHNQVLELMSSNIRLNLQSNFVENTPPDDNTILNSKYLDTQVVVLNLPWENTQLPVIFNNNKFDYVVAADVIFDHDHFKPLSILMKTLTKLNNSLEILLFCTIRNPDTVHTFFSVLHSITTLKETLIGCEETWSSNYDGHCEVHIYSIKNK